MDAAGSLAFPGIPRSLFLHNTHFLNLNLVSTGSAGIIQTIQRFSHRALVAGVLGVIATVGWAVQGLGNAFYYRQVIPSQSCHHAAIDSDRFGHITALLATQWKR
jgi:SCAMP family protein